MTQTSYLAIVAFSILYLCSPAPADEEVEAGGIKITLGEPWRILAAEITEKTGYTAVRIDPRTKRPNAAIVAKELTKSAAEEAEEMASSAEKQPEVISLLEARTVELKDGTEARVVSLEIEAGNRQLGIAPPMVFHSIYLPTKDRSVTFKLQCAKADLAELKAGFERMVLSKLAD